jgi:hypothetical protein
MKLKPIGEYRKFTYTIAKLKYNRGGIYFLYKSGILQYVGQSATVASRIRNHPVIRGSNKSDWIVEVIRVDAYGRRRHLENKFIIELNPPLNKRLDYAGLAVKLRVLWAERHPK